jgi:hypothetical protein
VERGDVYLTTIDLPIAGGYLPRDKYLILLQSPAAMDPGATNIATVVASTDRSGSSGARAFEVRLGVEDGFRRATMVDGRWVYTIRRADLSEHELQFRLSDNRMEEISLAVLIGLQLDC